MIKIEAYTDGSCSGNPGPGGWSFVMLENGVERKRESGSDTDTTNNIMEMMAAIKVFEELEKIEFFEEVSVSIISDSAYLVNAFAQDWISGWLKNGWINSRREPVANKELWESLIYYQKKYSATFIQIKRRSNNYAILVDAMAKKPSLNKPS